MEKPKIHQKSAQKILPNEAWPCKGCYVYASSVILENKSDELQPLVFELTSFFLQFELAATLLLDVELIILDYND